MLYELVGAVGEDYSEASYEEKYADDETDPVKIAEKAAAELQEQYNSQNQYLMIIPSDDPATTDVVEAIEASVDITYFLPGAGYYSMNVPLKNKTTGEYIQFEARKAYDFKFKVSTNGISFSVYIDGWDDSAASESFDLL